MQFGTVKSHRLRLERFSEERQSVLYRFLLTYYAGVAKSITGAQTTKEMDGGYSLIPPMDFSLFEIYLHFYNIKPLTG